MNATGLTAFLGAVCGIAGQARAIDAVSRFDSGAEGWTLEGPGTLEWVASGGNWTGYLKVTRTGPGEVYLVAPAQFIGDWRGEAPRLFLSYKPAASATRGLLLEVSGPAGQFERATNQIGMYLSNWTANSFYIGAQSPEVQAAVTRVRIRLGTDVTLPVGEVMRVDDIGLKSCSVNCDGSTSPPMINANDFQCFLNAIARNDPYANFDGQNGIVAPEEFQAYLNNYAQSSGCVVP